MVPEIGPLYKYPAYIYRARKGRECLLVDDRNTILGLNSQIQAKGEDGGTYYRKGLILKGLIISSNEGGY